MRETEIRHLPCVLTEQELLQKGQLAANAVKELRELEDEKARVSKSLGDDIKGKRSELSKLGLEISSKTEYRAVECDVVMLFEREMVITVRTDTGEKVYERKMTEGEFAAAKQARLPGIDRNAADH